MTGNGIREWGEGTQPRAAGRTQTSGRCSEDRTSVHGSHALQLSFWGAQQQLVLVEKWTPLTYFTKDHRAPLTDNNIILGRSP